MSKHTQYGTVVDSGIPLGDGGTEAFVDLEGCINVQHMSVLPTEFKFNDPDIRLDGEGAGSFLAVSLTGAVFGREETVSVTYVLPWMDAGQLVAMITDAAHRSTNEHSEQDFAMGFVNEQQRREDEKLDKGSDTLGDGR